MTLLDWAWSNIFQISLIVSPAITATMWAVRATFPSKTAMRKAIGVVNARVEREVKVLNDKFLQFNDRMTKVEGAMNGLATKEDVGRVLIALERQDGERKALEEKVDEVKAELRSIARPLDLIQEHLLNGHRR